MYEKQAKENLSKAGQEYGVGKEKPLANLPNPIIEPISTRQKLAEVAGVGEKTYAMGSKILQSNNEDIKEKVLSGEMSINAGYNAIKPQKKAEESVFAEVYISKKGIANLQLPTNG